MKRIISHRECTFEEARSKSRFGGEICSSDLNMHQRLSVRFYVYSFLLYTLIQLHSVSGILGYKINFDSNGDAEFNLTLLDMQPIGKLMLILAFPERLEGYSRDQGFAQKTALDSGNVNGIRDLTDLTFTGEAAPIANKVCDWMGKQ